jgi:hypothetical protein
LKKAVNPYLLTKEHNNGIIDKFYEYWFWRAGVYG